MDPAELTEALESLFSGSTGRNGALLSDAALADRVRALRSTLRRLFEDLPDEVSVREIREAL